jgi:hypothetical protein
MFRRVIHCRGEGVIALGMHRTLAHPGVARYAVLMRSLRIDPARGVLRWCGIACALMLAGCMGAAHTQASTASRGAADVDRDGGLPVPFDLQEGVERATMLGENLFFLEVATQRAQNALAERIGSPEAHGIGHYLALVGDDAEGRSDGSAQVLFFTAGDVPRLAYRVTVPSDSRRPAIVAEQAPPGIVHEPLMTLLSARQLALEAVPAATGASAGGQALNTVLMPQRDGQIVVYVLAAAHQPNMAVLGPHYRVEVAEDGAAVENVTALSRAEVELPTRDRAGQRLAALNVTEGDVDHPTETHVFASCLANVPIIVTTGRGRWKVRATGIDYLGPR